MSSIKRFVLFGIALLALLLTLTACEEAQVFLPRPKETAAAVTDTPEATPEATPELTEEPSAELTAVPTEEHTQEPTEEPTETPEPTATPQPTDTPEPTATPEPTEEPTPAPDLQPFQVVWASDTQMMIARYTEMLNGWTAMCDWVTEHAESDNIRLFVHTGDMVDGSDNQHQWEHFSDGAKRISEKVPLFMIAGNHDKYDPQRKSYWQRQFFVKEFPADQQYRTCEAMYMELAAGDFHCLLIGVSYHQQMNSRHVEWLKKVCDEHPDLPVILVCHAYLGNNGKLMDRAEKLEQMVVSQCPNLRLILCGHSRGIKRNAFHYDDNGDGEPDRTVNVLMYDVQEDLERYGYMNILTFDPLNNTLSVLSYSPYLDDYIYDDENPDRENFKIDNVF